MQMKARIRGIWLHGVMRLLAAEVQQPWVHEEWHISLFVWLQSK
jgi:hypothetical protein